MCIEYYMYIERLWRDVTCKWVSQLRSVKFRELPFMICLALESETVKGLQHSHLRLQQVRK